MLNGKKTYLHNNDDSVVTYFTEDDPEIELLALEKEFQDSIIALCAKIAEKEQQEARLQAELVAAEQAELNKKAETNEFDAYNLAALFGGADSDDDEPEPIEAETIAEAMALHLADDALENDGIFEHAETYGIEKLFPLMENALSSDDLETKTKVRDLIENTASDSETECSISISDDEQDDTEEDYFSAENEDSDFYDDVPLCTLPGIAESESGSESEEEMAVQNESEEIDDLDSDSEYFSDDSLEEDFYGNDAKDPAVVKINDAHYKLGYGTFFSKSTQATEQPVTNNPFVLKLLQKNVTEWSHCTRLYDMDELKKSMLKGRTLYQAAYDSTVFKNNERHDRAILFLYTVLYRDTLDKRTTNYSGWLSSMTGYGKDVKDPAITLLQHFLINCESLSKAEGFINSLAKTKHYGPLTQYYSDLGAITNQIIERSRYFAEVEKTNNRKFG